MSVSKPAPDENAIARAVAVLAAAAQTNLAGVKARLEAAGLGITSHEPFRGNPDIDASVPSDIGAVIKGRGIYHGAWQPVPNGVIVHAYSDTDFLRDASGRQMLLTWYEARDELARRNAGRRYGGGAEASLIAALSKPPGTEWAYKDGDLVMGPRVLLNGKDNVRVEIRPHNTDDLLSRSRGEAFARISETLREAPAASFERWSWTSSQAGVSSSGMWAVRLSDGNDIWYDKDVTNRLGVLPFRFFREPHAVKAVSHLNS